MQQRLNSLSCAKSLFNTAALRRVQWKEGSYVTMWMSSSRLGCLSSFVFNTSATSYSLLERRFKGWNEWTMTPFTENCLTGSWCNTFCFSVLELRGDGLFLCVILGSWQILTPTSPCAFYCKCCFAWLFWNNRGNFSSSTIMMTGNVK